MRYNKPHLTFEQQAQKLIDKGLICSKHTLIDRLKAVSYYRLSAYWYPFRTQNGLLKPDTTLEQIWRRYVFDRQLRLLVMDATERVEIHIRTHITNLHSVEYGAFGYTRNNTLPNLKSDRHQVLINNIRTSKKSSQESFINHYNLKYQEEEHLPLWMASELMTFGDTLSMYKGLSNDIRRKIAKIYDIHQNVLDSWLHTLLYTRNLCAHHSRLWNREWAIKPKYPNKDSYWKYLRETNKHRIFGVLSILRHLQSIIAPQSRWKDRLLELLRNYQDIPLDEMGFPMNWQQSHLL